MADESQLILEPDSVDIGEPEDRRAASSIDWMAERTGQSRQAVADNYKYISNIYGLSGDPEQDFDQLQSFALKQKESVAAATNRERRNPLDNTWRKAVSSWQKFSQMAPYGVHGFYGGLLEKMGRADLPAMLGGEVERISRLQEERDDLRARGRGGSARVRAIEESIEGSDVRSIFQLEADTEKMMRERQGAIQRTLEEIGVEHTRLSEWWGELQREADKRMDVDPEFANSFAGKAIGVISGMPPLVGMSALGPPGWAMMFGVFFAEGAETRRAEEGEDYDPNKAWLSNVIYAAPAMLLERWLGGERLINKMLKATVVSGKMTAGTAVRNVVKRILTTAPEEGVEEMAQGFWNDVVAKASYNPELEIGSWENLKQRLEEGFLGALGGLAMTSVISPASDIDVYRANREFLTSRELPTANDGKAFLPGEWPMMREGMSDEDVRKRITRPDYANLFIEAINGDKAAQARYTALTVVEKGKAQLEREVEGFTVISTGENERWVATPAGNIALLDGSEEAVRLEGHIDAIEELSPVAEKLGLSKEERAFYEPLEARHLQIVPMQGAETGVIPGEKLDALGVGREPGKGKFLIFDKEGTVIHEATSADTARDFVREEQKRQRDIVAADTREMITWAEQVAGGTMTVQDRPLSMQEAVDKKLVSEKGAIEAVRGIRGDPEEDVNDLLANYAIQGRHRAEYTGNVMRHSILIASGANPATPIEEIGHKYFAESVRAQGELFLNKVRTWKTQEEEHKRKKYKQEPVFGNTERDLNEWFAERVVDEVIGQTLEPGGSGTMESEVPIPDSFRRFVDKLIVYMRHIITRASQWIEYRSSGAADPEFLEHVAKAVGFHPAVIKQANKKVWGQMTLDQQVPGTTGRDEFWDNPGGAELYQDYLEHLAKTHQDLETFDRLIDEGMVIPPPDFQRWHESPQEYAERRTREEAELGDQAAIDEGRSGDVELLKAIGRGLVHPDTAKQIGEPLAEELRQIYEELGNKHRKRPEKRKYPEGHKKAGQTYQPKVKKNYAEIRKLFMKKGARGSLDDLRRELNGEGFSFETPGDLIDAIWKSLTGVEQFPTYGEFSEAKTAYQAWEEEQEVFQAVPSADFLPFREVPETAAKFQDIWSGQGVSNETREIHDGAIRPGVIIVPPDLRKGGIGTAFMMDLTRFADHHGKIIVLTPSRDFGATSIARLRRFYARFGFKRNLGRNKDFRFMEAMIRQPKDPPQFNRMGIEGAGTLFQAVDREGELPGQQDLFSEDQLPFNLIGEEMLDSDILTQDELDRREARAKEKKDQGELFSFQAVANRSEPVGDFPRSIDYMPEERHFTSDDDYIAAMGDGIKAYEAAVEAWLEKHSNRKVFRFDDQDTEFFGEQGTTLVTREPTDPNRWRATWFSQIEGRLTPTGHMIFKDKREAIEEAATFGHRFNPIDTFSAAAFHGSPHRFDRFDMSKVGTGEGHQAYGFGLYFSGKKEVAGWYKDRLSSFRSKTKYKGEEIGTLYSLKGPTMPIFQDVKRWLSTLPETQVKRELGREDDRLLPFVNDVIGTAEAFFDDPAGLQEAIDAGEFELTQFEYFPNPAAIAKLAQRLIQEGFTVEKIEGSLYQVELAPNEDEYLLWDEPLSEQSDKVKEALGKMGSDEHPLPSRSAFVKDMLQPFEVGVTGGANVVMGLGADRQASEYLRSLGIRGIKYFDGSSRRKGEGSYNYVIFDDADVSITDTFQLAAPNMEDPVWDSVKETMGTTRDMREAGYILPDGTLLDFSGKRNGGESGVRQMDHREVDYEGAPTGEQWASMVDIMNRGAVRVDFNSGMVSTHGLLDLTNQQERQIQRLARMLPGVLWLDVEEDGPPTRRAGFEVSTPKKTIGLIRRFKAGEELIDREGEPIFQIAERQPEKNEKLIDLEREVDELRREQLEKLLGGIPEQGAPEAYERQMVQTAPPGWRGDFLDTMMTIGSRLRNADLGTFSRLRRFEFDVNRRVKTWTDQIIPIQIARKQLSNAVRDEFDLALENRHIDTVEEIAIEYGFSGELARAFAMFDEMHRYATQAGFDVGYLTDYWPRWIKNMDGLIDSFGEEHPQVLEDIINEAGKSKILTPEDKQMLINRVLEALHKAEVEPRNFKNRLIEEIDMARFKEFYADPITAGMAYIHRVVEAVETRRFFGQMVVDEEVKSPEIKLTEDGNIEVVKEGIHMRRRVNLDESIGAVLQARGEKISAGAYAEIQNMLRAYFNFEATPTFWRNLRGLTYITSLGQFSSAVRQLEDVTSAWYEGGIRNTKYVKGVRGRDEINVQEDLGLDLASVDYKDAMRSGMAIQKSLNVVLTGSGLRYFGRGGQAVQVNTSLRSYRENAKKGKLTRRQMTRLTEYFGEDEAEIAAVMRDLKSDKKTDRTIFLGWNILLDYQPGGRSEMPASYARNPRGRLWYMLKSFTLKRLDVYRREGIREITEGMRAGDWDRARKGFRNLMHLWILYLLGGASVNTIIDMLHARNPHIDDSVVDAWWQLFGVTRWNIHQFDRGEPVYAAFKILAPPHRMFEVPVRDAKSALTDPEWSIDRAETWNMVPWGGKPFFWHVGEGTKWTERKEQKRLKEQAKR